MSKKSTKNKKRCIDSMHVMLLLTPFKTDEVIKRGLTDEKNKYYLFCQILVSNSSAVSAQREDGPKVKKIFL